MMTRYGDLYRPTKLCPSELVAVEIAWDELRSYAEMLDRDAGVDKLDYEKYQWAVRKLEGVLARATKTSVVRKAIHG